MDANSSLALLFAGFAVGVIFWQWDNIKEWADDDNFVAFAIVACFLIISFGIAMGIVESGR